MKNPLRRRRIDLTLLDQFRSELLRAGSGFRFPHIHLWICAILTLMAMRKAKLDITEAHPNPHGEQKVAEMPLRTDHSAATRENVAQNPNTRDNQMNPSVAVLREDPTDDSMFNNADPQTRELEEATHHPSGEILRLPPQNRLRRGDTEKSEEIVSAANSRE